MNGEETVREDERIGNRARVAEGQKATSRCVEETLNGAGKAR